MKNSKEITGEGLETGMTQKEYEDRMKSYDEMIVSGILPPNVVISDGPFESKEVLIEGNHKTWQFIEAQICWFQKSLTVKMKYRDRFDVKHFHCGELVFESK